MVKSLSPLVAIMLVALAADAASVTYTQQTSYYTKHTDGGDIFNNGGTEVGMWANTGNKNVVAWRTFKTAGNVTPGSGTNRALQSGDEFTITVNGDSPYGVLGVSLNDGASTSTWADRHSNARGYVETLSTYGNWYVYYSDDSQDSSSAPADDDSAIEFEITSSSTFNVRIKGGSWIYNCPMLNSPSISDRIDGYSIYYHDDYDGSGNQNAYWKQTTTVEDTGVIHFGGTVNTTAGLIADGLAASSTSTVRTNAVYKFGSHTLTLSATNTYSGTTYIEEGILALDATGSLGSGNVELGKTGEADSSELQFNDSDGGKDVTNALTVVDVTSGQRTIASTATSGTNTVSGAITHNDSSDNLRLYQAAGGILELSGAISGQGALWLDDPADGTFVLSGNNSFSGGVYLDGGTLEIAHANALGTGTLEVGPVDGFAIDASVDVNSGSLTVTNPVTMNDQPNDDDVYIRNNGSGAVTYSGPWTLNRGLDLENPGGGSLTLSGNVTLAGGTHDIITSNGNVTISGNVGGSVGMTKKGADQLTLSGANTFSGTTTVSAGTLLYSGTNTTSAVSVSGGAVLRGEGSVGALTVNDNAIVAAGAAASDVGTLAITGMTLAAGGSNVVEMSSADGVKGTGWDLLAGGGGTLTVSATSGNPFVIALDDSGATGFTNTNTYAWVIIEGGSVTDFAANKFSVDTSNFSPPLGSGSFSVGTNETDDLVLNFTPPATGPLLAVSPLTMTFSARRGQDPAAIDTFVVSNVNEGTLAFTNNIAYAAGASDWLTLNPGTGSVAAATGVTVTGTVTSASLARGTYYATNTVNAGAAGTNNVVVTLSVTGYTGFVTYEPVTADDEYANSEVLHGKTGGEGWGANAWTRNDSSPEIYIETGALDTFTDYCDDGALKARINMNEATSGDRFRECYRSFTALTQGMVYVAYKFKMEKNNAGNIGGVKLMDGAHDRIWVGKINAASKGLSIRHDGTSYAVGSYEITAGSTFLIVGRFDFGSQEFSAKAYTPAQFASVDEPGASGWDISATMSTPITSIDRISLLAERPTEDGDERGYVMWDDVRVATRWADLICGATVVQGVVTATNATFSVLEVGDKVSDQVLNGGAFPISLDLYDADVPIFVGTEADGCFTPEFDLVNASGNAIVQALEFSSLIASDDGKAVAASNTTLSSITSSNIPIGTVTMQWSAMDSNKAYRVNVPRLADGTDIDFDVYDDDTSGPVASLVYVGGSYTPGGPIQTNITDADLADTNQYLDIAVQWYDPGGVFMTNATTNLQINIGSENGRVIPNYDLFITNTVTHDTAQSGFDQVFTNFLGANGATTVTTVYYNAFSITNSREDDLYFLTISAEDEDNDRGTYTDPGSDGDPVPCDRMVTTNQFVQFTVTDNDADAPVPSALDIAGTSQASGTVLAEQLVSGAWSLTGRVVDATSGVNVNGVTTNGENISPFVQLVDPLGVVRLTETFSPIGFSDGDGTTPVDLAHTSPSGIDGLYAMTGVWTARVVTADNDEHREGDRTVGTNTLTFTVPADSDADAINDGWELAYLDSTGPDGTGDKDGDGILDEDEYLAGTDPDNTNSRLRLVSVDLKTPGGNDLDITFEGGGFIEPGEYAGVELSSTRAFRIRSSDTYGGAKSLDGYRNGTLSATNTYTDTNAIIETSQRFYEISVAYGGKAYTNSREWAMHVQPREAGKRYLVTVPVDYVDGSNTLNSTLGEQIARGLTAGDIHNDPDADQIQFDDGSGMSTYTLVTNESGGVEWWNGDGASSRTVVPGEGFWVYRTNSVAVRTNMVFVGLTRTGNVSLITITTNDASAGWDAQIIGWPYSTAVSTSGETTDPFGFISGGAYGGRQDDSGSLTNRGDQIWYWNDGWYYIWLIDDGTGGAPDDTWWDPNAGPFGANADFSLEPGKAYYYRHRVATEGAATGTNFNWQPALP